MGEANIKAVVDLEDFEGGAGGEVEGLGLDYVSHLLRRR